MHAGQYAGSNEVAATTDDGPGPVPPLTASLMAQARSARTVSDLAGVLRLASFLGGGAYPAVLGAAHSTHGNGFVQVALSVVATPQASAQGIEDETFARFVGKAFVLGKGDAQSVAPNDVVQGAVGDCWLMAAMMAVARASPDAIRDLIVDRGDGTYAVTLYLGASTGEGVAVKRTPTTFIVDAAMPVGDKGGRRYARSTDRVAGKVPQVELWPALIEKAYAKHMGSYVGMAYLGEGLDARFESAIEELLPTGVMESTPTSKLTPATATALLAKALQTHRPVTMMTPVSLQVLHPTLAKKWKLAEWHHYALRDVSVANQTISLDNPWGKDHVVDMPIADFLTCFAHVQIGPALSHQVPDAMPIPANMG